MSCFEIAHKTKAKFKFIPAKISREVEKKSQRANK